MVLQTIHCGGARLPNLACPGGRSAESQTRLLRRRWKNYSHTRSAVIRFAVELRQSGDVFSWTDSQSSGQINGYDNSMNATFSSDELDCYETIPIEYDTEYHTFVFWQPPGNSSCM